VGDCRARARFSDRSQVVVLARAHQGGIHGGARRNHAGDLATHRPAGFLGNFGIFHLVADRYPVAFLDEAGDVAVGRVVGDAGHRNGSALFLVARGEGDFELARGEDGVVVEQLVEIADPEEKQRIAYLLLGSVVLLHQGLGGVAKRRCLAA